ncbi:DNA (cytosine-5)-methyltransferase 3B [Asimina triloba]
MKRKFKNVENDVAGDSGAATTCGDNQSRKELMLGDIVWVKIRGSSWWPGQVLKQNNFSVKEILQKALEQGSNKKHASRKRSKGDPSAEHGGSNVTENPKQNGDEKNHKVNLDCSSHMP